MVLIYQHYILAMASRPRPMKSILSFLFVLTYAVVSAQDQTTFILVRHAEKDLTITQDPPLSEQGVNRAKKLAGLLESQDISALYSTPYSRTQQTLQPIAKAQGLAITSYSPSAGPPWLTELYEKHPGESIVIVGHSNTIPTLANHLLGSDKFVPFSEDEYSNLIIIVGREMGEGKLIRLKY